VGLRRRNSKWNCSTKNITICSTVLLNKYHWGDHTKEDEWVALVARMGDMRNTCMVLGGKICRKQTLGRSKLRWDDITKMDEINMRLVG